MSRLVACAAAATLAGTGAVTLDAGPAQAALSASRIHGVNWADERDNFVCGNLVPTGLADTDGYDAVHAKASVIASRFRTVVGANTVRLPVNVDTVTGSWWARYTGAIDASVEAGMDVLLSEWDQCNSRDGKLDPGWERMWDAIVAKYGRNRHVLFEIMNEPHGYTAAAWLDTAAAWIARYPKVPRRRIVVSGPGLNDNAWAVGRDARFAGTLLSIHHYAFWQGPHSYQEWREQTRDKVGEFASRAVFTEFGTYTTTGLDFGDASATTNEIQYLRGVTDELAALGVGSVYWPGLRAGDHYSLTTISGEGAGLEMTVTNASALDRLHHAWRQDPTPPAPRKGPLVGAQSGRCLTDPGGTATGGAQVVIGDCDGGRDQVFTYTAARELRVRGRCLDVTGQSRTAGATVTVYACNGGANQKWSFGSDGSVTGVQSGLCLDVVAQGTANGTKVDVWTCTGGANQRWTRG